MLKHCIIVFFVSMIPVIELRGAIPYGVAFGLPLWLTYIVAIIGNMLPVPIIYFFARRVLEWGEDKPIIGRFFTFWRPVCCTSTSKRVSWPAWAACCWRALSWGH